MSEDINCFRSHMQKQFWVFILLPLLLTACVGGMGTFAEIQVGKAYAEGKEIYFMHTEASDKDVAELLTNMMESPVLYVPALAQTPDSALATVYVFDNGLAGMGPLGFQPDVFDAPPGAAGYSPLRRLVVVSWVNPAQARELKSAAEVLRAESAGEVTLAFPGVVINMPFVTWDGGRR